mmetsp:Transcript_43327/g.108263  ORF Transcript_43327/g.108263 Transcript_43327/m.108263 type:complete len:255 (-) Transcript_43327:106-870(-)
MFLPSCHVQSFRVALSGRWGVAAEACSITQRCGTTLLVSLRTHECEAGWTRTDRCGVVAKGSFTTKPSQLARPVRGALCRSLYRSTCEDKGGPPREERRETDRPIHTMEGWMDDTACLSGRLCLSVCLSVSTAVLFDFFFFLLTLRREREGGGERTDAVIYTLYIHMYIFLLSTTSSPSPFVVFPSCYAWCGSSVCLSSGRLVGLSAHIFAWLLLVAVLLLWLVGWLAAGLFLENGRSLTPHNETSSWWRAVVE